MDRARPRVLMIFIDGLGAGPLDPEINPLARARLPALTSLCGGALPDAARASAPGMRLLDATLGVDGLPQSGTGQTALFTGTNAARAIGQHFGPWAHSLLHPVIRERSIFRVLRERGRRACFANAFPQRFFDFARRRRSRLTVTTLSCLESGTRLRDAADLATGRALSADITGEAWHGMGYAALPVLAPRTAGLTLAALAVDYDFVLFEYWLPDRAGHARDMDGAVAVLENLDALLVGVLEGIDAGRTLLVITSDHGNVEDLSTKSHTRNPVPLLASGSGAARLLESMAGDPALDALQGAILAVIG